MSPAKRNGKMIAVANMKGGVGKTTTVVGLAETLAAADAATKVLVIDLDPQASASMAIAGDDELNDLIDNAQTFENFIEQRLIKEAPADLHKAIHPTPCKTSHAGRQLDVALLACGPRLRAVERNLIFELAQNHVTLAAADKTMVNLFKKDILSLRSEYDFIIIDCAPGISPVTEVAIRLSDLVLVPTIPDRLSVYGLNAFLEGIWHGDMKSLPKPKSAPHVLIVRMDGRIKQHAEVLDALQAGAKKTGAEYYLMKSHIPTSAALVNAVMKDGFPIFTQKFTSAVIGDILKPLMLEVKGLCDGLRS